MGIIDRSRISLPSGADEGAPARGPAAAAAQTDREEEQALVRAVLGGSVAAWHLFIERYSGVLQAVIRRNLYSNDEDDVRTIYVDILSSLYRGRLATFAGRSTLSSWLVLVARSHTMDFLRHRFGRRELPAGVEKLAPRDREVFRFFHLEGFGVGEILERMSRNGDRFEVDDLLAAIQRIEERIDRRTLKRCDYHRQARSRGTGSGRLLELLDHLMSEADLAAREALPDAGLLLEEARDAEANIRRLIGLLPQEDRRVLDLKFVRNLSANEIARDIGLPGRRKAYTILSRALRRLRRLVLADGMAPGSGNGNGSDVSFPLGPRLARESEASD